MSGPAAQQSPSAQPPEPAPGPPGGRRLAHLVGLLLLAVLAAGYWFASYAGRPSPLAEETLVLIPKGTRARDIGTILARHRVLEDDFRFLLLAGLTGKAHHLRYGEYRIPPHATPLQILDLLEQGHIVRTPVTIPEGLNVEQIARLLAKGDWVDEQRFISLTRNNEFIRSLGLNQKSLEGYLFPDTYLLTKGDVTEEAILRLMTRRFLGVWQQVTATGKPAMNRHHVVTLASIVEKETCAPAERPLIARVFMNRLARKMRLQSDPTVIYGIKDFNGDLTRSDLRTRTPYNTYVIKGLPAGPICNPGREAIEAVLEPADSPYLYFVSKNDGTHQFSMTYSEHNRAVRKFQLARKEKKAHESVAQLTAGEAQATQGEETRQGGEVEESQQPH